MTVPREELRVLGYLFPCGRVGPKLWRIPKGSRTVPSCGIVGMESRIPVVVPQCQNYTCEVLAGTAVKPLDFGFSEGFASQGIQRHRKNPANFNGHLVFQPDCADSSPDFRADSGPTPRVHSRAYSHLRAYSSTDSSAGSIVNPSANSITDSNPTPSSSGQHHPSCKLYCNPSTYSPANRLDALKPWVKRGVGACAKWRSASVWCAPTRAKSGGSSVW